MTSSEEETATPEPAAMPEPQPAETAKPPKERNPGKTVAISLFGLATLLFVYHLFADRITPYSSAGYLRTYLVAIAPEVSGTVMEVFVRDNSRVEEGQILFQLDTADYEIAVAAAEAQLASAGQSIGSSTAGVSSAQAAVTEAKANLVNIEEQAARILELVAEGVYAEARADEAYAERDIGRANVEKAEANLLQAQEALGPQGNDNPLLQAALADLDKAQLNLLRASILAPSDGAVTGLQLTPGLLAHANTAVMTFIDLRDVWVVSYMTENNLGLLKAGDPVTIAFDVFPGQLFGGTVQSIGFGVAVQDTTAAGTLPSGIPGKSVTSGDLSYPVRIQLDDVDRPKGLRFGGRAGVIAFPTDNGLMNMLGDFRIWLASIWNYVG